MKLSIARPPFLLCTFLAFTSIARAGMDFTGVFVTSRGSKFALVDTAAGRSSWLSIGDRFDGYEVIEYNAPEQVLTLKKADEIVRLKLLKSQVKEGYFPLSGKITVGSGEATMVSDATFIVGVENTFPIEKGLILRLKAERITGGNLKYSSSLERTLPNGEKQWIQAPAMVGRPNQPVILQVEDYHFEFNPKNA